MSPRTPTPPSNEGKAIAKQFGRFMVVGGANTGVDLAILNLLIFATGTGTEGWSFTLFKTVAFSVAVANSYLLNKIWTFESKGDGLKKELVPFLLVSMVGLILNVGTATLFATWVPIPFESLTPYWPSIASLAGTGAGLVWNFVGYRQVVFTDTDDDTEEEEDSTPASIQEFASTVQR